MINPGEDEGGTGGTFVAKSTRAQPQNHRSLQGPKSCEVRDRILHCICSLLSIIGFDIANNSVLVNDSKKPTCFMKSGVLVSVESLGAVFQPAAPLTANVGIKTKTSRLKLLQMTILDYVNVANVIIAGARF